MKTKIKTLKVYQVVQNIDGLKGRYFVSAVVISTSRVFAENAALRKARSYEDDEETGAALIFDHDRVSTRYVGRVSKKATLPPVGINRIGVGEILAFQTGEDNE